jgi:putative membrane protein
LPLEFSPQHSYLADQELRRLSMRGIVALVAVAAILSGTVSSSGAESAHAAGPTAEQTDFVNIAAQAGKLAIEAATVALHSTNHPIVKEFAYRMIYDYETMNADLARIAGKRGISVPTGLDVAHSKALQALRDTPSTTFDTAYLESMALQHAKTTELLLSNLRNADTELAVFSSYNLPKVREHKRLAGELKAQLAR